MTVLLLVAGGLLTLGVGAAFMGGDVFTRGFKREGASLPSQRTPTDPVPRSEVVAAVMIMGGLAVASLGAVMLATWLVLLAV